MIEDEEAPARWSDPEGVVLIVMGVVFLAPLLFMVAFMGASLLGFIRPTP